MKITPEDLVHRSADIGTLPNIYIELDREINNPLSHLEDVAAIILDDTGLSARLLKLANSAMFKLPSKVDTITRAITLIGTKQLRDLALSTSVISMFNGIDQSAINMEEFWKHCISTGIAARILATYQSESNVERFYLMGLLHDIGRLIMFLGIPEIMSDLITRSANEKRSLNELEMEVLGFGHGMVGQLLLRHWKLPPPITDAVGHHHYPLRSREYYREASVIHVSELLSNSIQFGSSGGISIAPKLDVKAWDNIGLSSTLVPNMLQHIESQYSDAVEIFLS
jgi:putative nucleotidyltransferase with HDIG domain